MHVTHRKRFVGRELIALAATQPQPFAEISERQYHDQLALITQEVLQSHRRIVMLTGASAAGKTTSAHKLAALLRAENCPAAVLSLDDFFVGAGRYPKAPDGSDDYERLESLDIPVLQGCLRDLYQKGVCQSPVFDFHIQQPAGLRTVDCRGGVAIIEGLHALNPALTAALPEDAVLYLYAGLREEYADTDGSRCLATRDIRLARRIVRDALFRGHEASFTLGMWAQVCAGEDLYIRPFKSRANLLLDTAHSYEPCLWNTLLTEVQPDAAMTPAQCRLLKALKAKFALFPALPADLVPQNSLLREFIGTKEA